MRLRVKSFTFFKLLQKGNFIYKILFIFLQKNNTFIYSLHGIGIFNSIK